MSSIQIIGIAIAAGILVILVVALIVTRRKEGAAAGNEIPEQPPDVTPETTSVFSDAPRDEISQLAEKRDETRAPSAAGPGPVTVAGAAAPAQAAASTNHREEGAETATASAGESGVAGGAAAWAAGPERGSHAPDQDSLTVERSLWETPQESWMRAETPPSQAVAPSGLPGPEQQVPAEQTTAPSRAVEQTGPAVVPSEQTPTVTGAAEPPAPPPPPPAQTTPEAAPAAQDTPVRGPSEQGTAAVPAHEAHPWPSPSSDEPAGMDESGVPSTPDVVAPDAAAARGPSGLEEIADETEEPEPGGEPRLTPLSSVLSTTNDQQIDLNDPEVRRMLRELVKNEIDLAQQYKELGQNVDAILQLTEAERICTTLGMTSHSRLIREMLKELGA